MKRLSTRSFVTGLLGLTAIQALGGLAPSIAAAVRASAFSPSDSLLTSLAASMNDRKAPLNDVANNDPSFDTGIPAGFVYLGQFIDHDMTLDRTPLSDQQQDLKGLVPRQLLPDGRPHPARERPRPTFPDRAGGESAPAPGPLAPAPVDGDEVIDPATTTPLPGPV